jgi:hypothetical protein
MDPKLAVVNLNEETTNMHLIHSTHTQYREVPQERLKYQIVDFMQRAWPTWLNDIMELLGELMQY